MIGRASSDSRSGYRSFSLTSTQLASEARPNRPSSSVVGSGTAELSPRLPSTRASLPRIEPLADAPLLVSQFEELSDPRANGSLGSSEVGQREAARRGQGIARGVAGVNCH